MITRQEIINELNKISHLEKDAKDVVISAYLDSKGVPQEERDKILSDLISYVEY